MVNFNGNIIGSKEPLFSEANRAFRYGDSLFETIRTSADKINFWEDHYFRLMASMRILRMEIPMEFTMEFLAAEIEKLLEAGGLNQKPARVRLSVFRNEGGIYRPETHKVSFLISAEEHTDPFFVTGTAEYRVELFKEHYVNSGLLSTLKTNNRIINVVGSIYAEENKMANYILLNNNKQVVEALNGNIFLVKGKMLITPPILDGCINGIIRKKILEICKKDPELELEEKSISPFEIQKADEVFITNAITGIQSVTHYRRKVFKDEVARNLIGKLNALARFS